MTYKIAIAGAGIGGLTVAALLARQGHQISLYDQFDAPRPVGSGLVVQPVGQAVLDDIGAGDAARVAGNPIRRMLGHEAEHGRRVLDVTYDHDADGSFFGLAIHRASLFDILHRAATECGVEITPSHKVTGYAKGDLHFEGGASAGPFDLVVDSSGVSSPLSPITARPLPYGAIWGTVPWRDCGLPQDQLTQVYSRADRMIGVMPSGTLPGSDIQQASVFWSMPRDGYDAWRARPLSDWHDEIAQLWPEALPIFGQITAHDQMTLAQYAHGTLRRPYADRLAIIGDAAHKASPQLGQGANMAMLDASALAKALAQHPLQDALPAYALARRWHVRIYQLMSWAFTPQYQSDSRLLPALRDRVLFPASQIPPVPKVLTRLVRGDMIPPMASLSTRD